MDTARETKLFSRIRRALATGFGRLRDNGWPVIQTAAAAAIAYFLTAFILGIDYQQAFYAPIAAVVCLSLTLGQPKRRAILVTIGVAVGLTVGSLIVLAIGVGPVQMGLVVALAINYLFPVDPERMVERAARPIFEELVSTLEEVAAALKDGDLDRMGRALSQARGIDERVSDFRNTLTAGQETARFAPLRRGELGHLQVYADAVDRIDLAVRGGRSVARAAMGIVRHGSPASGPLSGAVLEPSQAVQALAAYLEQPGDPEDVRRLARDAAGKATATLKEHGGDLATSVLVGQIRTTTLDLLMSTGMDQTQALQALEEAAGSASEID